MDDKKLEMQIQLSSNQSIYFICGILLKHCNICAGPKSPHGLGLLWPKTDMFNFVCELEVEGAVTNA